MSMLQVLLVVSIAMVFVYSEDYCSLSCGTKSNVGCNPIKHFAKSCPKDVKLVDMVLMEHTIVDEHNKYRQRVANGEVPNHSKAAEMREMLWDDDLSALATYHTFKCEFKHDDCLQTKKYHFVTQNLYASWTTARLDRKELVNTVKLAVLSFFNEYVDSNMTYIKQYHKNDTNDQHIGHFFNMINEKATHVGCAALIVSNSNFNMTCNYVATDTDIVYVPSSEAGSNCKIPSKRYKGLCANSG